MVANNNAIPPQGTPGVFDGRNPTLLPNFSPAVAATAGPTLDNTSPAAFLIANPRVDATATATFGGSVTTGDKITLEVANPVLASQGFSKLAFSYTTLGGDTLSNIAEAFATLINDNANAEAADIRADAALAVLTLRQAGPVGNFTTIAAPTEEPATLTVAGTAHTGDTFSALFTGPGLGANGVLIQSPSTTGNTATQDAQALKTVLNANATLTAAGISATGAAAVLTLVVPAGDFNVSAWVNSAAPTFTVGGTVTAGDTVTATFTSAAGLGAASPRSIVYAVKLTDTTTDLIGLGLAAAINADAILQSAGITAADVSSVVTVSYPGRIGQLRISSTVSGGATETLTSSAAPTATIALATTATETITLSNAGKLSGGTGPVIAVNNFTWAFGGSQVQAFYYGRPYLLGQADIAAMVAAGSPIV